MSTSTRSVPSPKRLLVTGGAGFMGSAFVRHALQQESIDAVVTFDLLTYAGSLDNLSEVIDDPRHTFVRGDVLNGPLVEEMIRAHAIDTIVHFAAESHVDRSIVDPRLFYRTNVEGTLSLLEVVRRFPHIHFHHISTDEVYGSVEQGECTEDAPYCPSSPYAASKAAADHLALAYAKTYGLSVTLSRSVNNYGPCQFEEKLIPLMIRKCLNKEPLPIYGSGANIRDWLFVEDHARAVFTILERGEDGHSYNIGAKNWRTNLDLLRQLVVLVASQRGERPECYKELLTFVDDRPGHDLRYALSSDKLHKLGWKPRICLEKGIAETVRWYCRA